MHSRRLLVPTPPDPTPARPGPLSSTELQNCESYTPSEHSESLRSISLNRLSDGLRISPSTNLGSDPFRGMAPSVPRGEFEFSRVSLSSSLSRWSRLASDADGIHVGAAASEVSTDMPGRWNPRRLWRVSESLLRVSGDSSSTPWSPRARRRAGAPCAARLDRRIRPFKPPLRPRGGAEPEPIFVFTYESLVTFFHLLSGGEGPPAPAFVALFVEYLTQWGSA